MKVDVFSNLAKLTEVTELEKICYLAFYFIENKEQPEFTIADMSAILIGLGFAKPNASRLKEKLLRSSDFIKGSRANLFRLSQKKYSLLKSKFPDLSDSEEINSDDSLLPEILLHESKRQYLIKIAQQINSAYENNLFDACSLMMRRLLEILIIHCFEAENIPEQIKDEEGNFQNLKTLINKIKSKSEIKLSPEAKKEIDTFRELGNLSAHRIRYNCRRDDIRNLKLEYRAIIEELLYLAKLTKVNTASRSH
ncbi:MULTISPECIES: DUF4145 domain-containing protein [Pseudomonas]|uniref:DUF4145 domain-containing protein n=1 Tax=Pseudomonas fluorescens TaxID=294 RepID=A0A0N9WKF7_PSEFL|nr:MULTISPECIES: DUF4145 domain-containing protein [Pseudomonas]ALI08763.1 hypothetical protein AO356_18675 [Pseudomonas fluorescens]